jgi:hypothetical protein
VLDRAPVLLRSRHHLAHIGRQPVGVGAIGAVELLDQVQVAQVRAFEHHVVAPTPPRDAVQRKAQPLVQRDGQIHQQQRQQQRVDQRRGDHVAPLRFGHAAQQALAEAPLLRQHLLLEGDTAVLEVGMQLGATATQLLFDRLLDVADSVVQVLQSGVHRRTSWLMPIRPASRAPGQRADPQAGGGATTRRMGGRTAELCVM